MIEALSTQAQRVLGVLVEKELSTPEYYPMTVNALVNGCNQKSNRDPVVEYRSAEVEGALAELQRRHLVGKASGAGSRAVKYRHALAEQLRINREERAVLATLLLRGPQTIGEVKSRSERMAAMEGLDQTAELLRVLAERDDPLVAEMSRRPGQKEPRYCHLLGDTPAAEVSADVASGEPAADATPPSATRDDDLADLRARLERLEAEFARFRRQFE